MAYEYEWDEIEIVVKEDYLKLKRKAKAFDEVIEKAKTEFVSEDLADAIRTLVNDYEYDKEDKQNGL